MAIALLAAVFSGCVFLVGDPNTRLFGTVRGQVLDAGTKEPVPHATVTVRCGRVGRYWHLHPEGYFLPDVVGESDEAGRYAVRLNRSCSTVLVHPAKDGYLLPLNPSSNATFGSSSFDVYLLPHDVGAMERLVALRDEVLSTRWRNLKATSQTDFLYSKFIQSRKLARTREAISLVINTYCLELKALHARLSAEDRERLAERIFSESGEPVPYSYEKEVEPFCTSYQPL